MAYIAKQVRVGVNEFPVSAVLIYTNDVSATVFTAGYLGPVVNNSDVVFSNHQVAFVYTTDDGMAAAQISVTNGIASLIALTPSPSPFAESVVKVTVELPTVQNQIPVFLNDSGELWCPVGNDSSTYSVFFPGNIIAGQSSIDAPPTGVAGNFTSYSYVSNSGKFVMVHSPNASGNFTTTLTDSSVRQSTAYILPDPCAANGSIQVAAMPNNDSDPCANLISKVTTITNANLSGGAHVSLYVPPSLTANLSQYQILNISMYVSQPFTGGNRDLIITDGSTTYSVIPLSSGASLGNYYWGSVKLPLPNGIAANTSTTAGSTIYATYAGGSGDYSVGSLSIGLLLSRVA